MVAVQHLNFTAPHAELRAPWVPQKAIKVEKKAEKAHSSMQSMKHNRYDQTLASLSDHLVCLRNFRKSNPFNNIEKSALVISTLAALVDGSLKVPFSSRLYQIAYPSRSQYKIFTQSSDLFLNTKR